ncbi:unnamed protein product [Closterium sp. NIES-65]|nr:unnamed protein product [Closterium sp. NIES-65]
MGKIPEDSAGDREKGREVQRVETRWGLGARLGGSPLALERSRVPRTGAAGSGREPESSAGVAGAGSSGGGGTERDLFKETQVFPLAVFKEPEFSLGPGSPRGGATERVLFRETQVFPLAKTHSPLSGFLAPMAGGNESGAAAGAGGGGADSGGGGSGGGAAAVVVAAAGAAPAPAGGGGGAAGGGVSMGDGSSSGKVDAVGAGGRAGAGAGSTDLGVGLTGGGLVGRSTLIGGLLGGGRSRGGLLGGGTSGGGLLGEGRSEGGSLGGGTTRGGLLGGGTSGGGHSGGGLFAGQAQFPDLSTQLGLRFGLSASARPDSGDRRDGNRHGTRDGTTEGNTDRDGDREGDRRRDGARLAESRPPESIEYESRELARAVQQNRILEEEIVRLQVQSWELKEQNQELHSRVVRLENTMKYREQRGVGSGAGGWVQPQLQRMENQVVVLTGRVLQLQQQNRAAKGEIERLRKELDARQERESQEEREGGEEEEEGAPNWNYFATGGC